MTVKTSFTTLCYVYIYIAVYIIYLSRSTTQAAAGYIRDPGAEDHQQ